MSASEISIKPRIGRRGLILGAVALCVARAATSGAQCSASGVCVYVCN